MRRRWLGHHEQQMMVIRSPLSDFLALWSLHWQVKNRPQGADSADPYYQICCFLWHVVCQPTHSMRTPVSARLYRATTVITPIAYYQNLLFSVGTWNEKRQ